MIGSWMFYAVLVAVAASLAGLAAERALRLVGRPHRWAWAVSLAASLALPVAAAVWAAVSARSMGASVSGDMANPAGAPLLLGGGGLAAPSFDWLAFLDGMLAWVWIVASLVAAGALLRSAAVLRRSRQRWRRMDLSGSDVLVSGGTGPAVVGFLRGSIVIPEWVLSLSAEEQRLIVEHEREHVRARDPLLVFLGRVVTVVMPWNLPLWWQLRRLRLAVEIDCDRRVLAGGASTLEYGVLLLEVSRRSSRRTAWAAAFAESPSFLERRIRQLTRRPPRRRMAQASLLLVLVALVTAGVSALPLPNGSPLDQFGAQGGGEMPEQVQGPVSLWISAGDTYHLGSAVGPVVPLSELERRLREERARGGARSISLNAMAGAGGYSVAMAQRAACVAGYTRMIFQGNLPADGQIRPGSDIWREESALSSVDCPQGNPTPDTALVAERPVPNSDGPVRGSTEVGAISGTVRDPVSGQPLPAAFVVIPGRARGTLTSPDGRFELAGVPVGDHRVAVLVRGRSTLLSRTVTVAAGSTTTADFLGPDR